MFILIVWAALALAVEGIPPDQKELEMTACDMLSAMREYGSLGLGNPLTCMDQIVFKDQNVCLLDKEDRVSNCITISE